MDNSDSAGKEGRPRVDHPTRIPDVFPFGYNGIRFRQSSSNSNVRGASELAGLGWSWRVFNPPLENPDNEFRLEAAHDLHIAPIWAAAGNQAARIGTSGYQSAANYYAPAPSGPLIGRPGYHTAGSYNSHLYNLPAAVVGGVGNHEQNMNPSGGMNEEVDSHGKFKIEEVPHDNREKYKTELCYHWERHGHCPYGDHCIFAHGEQELRPVTRHANYKTKLCYNVLARGSCRFGRRCHFRHALSHNI